MTTTTTSPSPVQHCHHLISPQHILVIICLHSFTSHTLLHLWITTFVYNPDHHL